MTKYLIEFEETREILTVSAEDIESIELPEEHDLKYMMRNIAEAEKHLIEPQTLPQEKEEPLLEDESPYYPLLIERDEQGRTTITRSKKLV